MNITKLSLKNWGRHKASEWDTDAAVVGVVGTNGKGKSTVLKAVRFALTGGTKDQADKDTLESFIHNRGNPPPKSAVVSAGLRKNGIDGLIERKVTKTTTSRKFTWEGKDYTKSEEVEALLSDMLGASKRAIANVVFIPQGRLNDVLFGTPAERETLFMRLLLLDHLEDAAKQLDKSIAILSEGLQDHTVALDEIMAQRRTIETSLAAITQQLVSARDWSTAIELMQQTDAAKRLSEETLPASVEAARRALATARENLTSALAIPADQFSGQQAEVLTQYPALVSPEKVEDLEGALDAVKAEIARMTAVITWLDREASLKKTEQETGARLQQWTADVERLRPLVADSAPEDLQRIQALESALQDFRSLRFINGNLEASRNAMESALQAFASAYGEQMRLETAWTAKEPEIAAQEKMLSEKIPALESLASLQKTILESADSAHCPLCKQSVAALNVTREAYDRTVQDLAETKEELRKQTAARGAAVTSIRQATSIAEQASRDLEKLKGEIQAAEQQLAELSGKLGGFDEGHATQELNALKGKEAAIAETDLKFRNANTEQKKAKAAYDTVVDSLSAHRAHKPEGAEDSAYEWTKNQIAAREQVVAALAPRLSVLRTASSAVTARAGDFDRLSGDLYKAQADYMALQVRIAGDKLLSEIVQRVNNIPDILTDLRERQNAYQQLAGEKRSLENQSGTLRARQTDIETKIAQNAAKQTVITELKQLKDLFSRSGLPMTYCRKKFTDLAALTQHYLSELESPFMVEPDPETDLSFRFKMLDEEDAEWLPQTKLSGGQRTRLTISFLLAGQRLIIPDVGLLVLDEPSASLDVESKDALARMFLDIGDKMAGSEFQIWVCDHSPELQQAFQKTINL